MSKVASEVRPGVFARTFALPLPEGVEEPDALSQPYGPLALPPGTVYSVSPLLTCLPFHMVS
jgi:hypothetical protein